MVQYGLELHQQITIARRCTPDCGKNPTLSRRLTVGGRDNEHGSCIDQLARARIHHKVEMFQKINPKYRELYIGEKENPSKLFTIQRNGHFSLPPTLYTAAGGVAQGWTTGWLL